MLNRNWCQIEADVTRGHSVEQVKYFWWRLVNCYQVSQQPLELVLVWYEMVTSDRRASFRSRIHLARIFHYLSLSPNEHANKWKWNNGRREGDGQTVAFMIIDFSVSSLIFVPIPAREVRSNCLTQEQYNLYPKCKFTFHHHHITIKTDKRLPSVKYFLRPLFVWVELDWAGL